MTNGMKELLALASKDESLARELESLSAETTQEGHERLIKLAASHGIILSEYSFTQPDMQELDLDEMDAVAGGMLSCNCIRAGKGVGNAGLCFCPLSGTGFDSADDDYWMN